MRTEDGALVYKSLNGEPEMFGILIDKYKASVYALVYTKLRNFHDAEDVTQEAFLQAFKNLRKLKNFDSFAVWLSSIASNLSKKWVRSDIRRIDNQFIEDKDPKIMEIPSTDSSQNDEISEALHEAIGSLPEIYQQVLTLHYLGGMSGMEIARTLGISHDTVRQRLSRAREQLREEMIAMMSQTFQQKRLSASFTFRIIEMVKKIKINPVSDARGLPWGLSLGAGIIFAILMLGQHIQINLPDIAMGLPLPSDTKILKIGEIPVEAVKVSTIASIADKGDGNGLAPDPKGQENAYFMAPQAEGGTWEKKVDMTEAKVWFKSVMINDKIYCMGGMNDNFQYTSSIEAYDFPNNKWTIKEKMLVPRVDFVAEQYDGKILAFGGSTQGGGDSLISVEEYDPEINKWSFKNNMPIRNGYMSSTTNDGLIYTIGGNSPGIHSQVYAYNPQIDKWERKADLPIPICGGEACSYNGKIYFMGGYTNALSISKKVFEYDPIADKWTELTDLPEARVFFTASVLNNKIYVIGGHSPKGTLSDIDIYDLSANTWEDKIIMPVGKSGLCSEVINDKIYVMGGTTFGDGMNFPKDVLSSVDCLSIDNNASVMKHDRLPTTWGNMK